MTPVILPGESAVHWVAILALALLVRATVGRVPLPIRFVPLVALAAWLFVDGASGAAAAVSTIAMLAHGNSDRAPAIERTPAWRVVLLAALAALVAANLAEHAIVARWIFAALAVREGFARIAGREPTRGPAGVVLLVAACFAVTADPFVVFGGTMLLPDAKLAGDASPASRRAWGGAALAAAGLVFLARGAVAPVPPGLLFAAVAACFVVGAANVPFPLSVPRLSAFAWLALGTGVGIAASICALGRLQFGAGDYSSIAVHAWVLHHGFRAYDDVATAYPPLFLLGAKWGFDVFGVRWISMVWVSAVFALASFLAQVALLRALRLRPPIALGVAATVQIVAMLPMSVWAYNPETAICAGLFLSAAALLHEAPDLRSNRAAFFVTAALLGLSKPNVAGVVFAGTAIALALSASRRVAFPLLFAAAAAAAGFLLLSGIDIAGMLAAYRGASSARIGSTGNFIRILWWNDAPWEAPRAVAAVAPLVVAGFLALRFSWDRGSGSRAPLEGRDRFGLALFAIALVAMGAAWVTNHEFKISETPPLLVAGSLWLFRLERLPAPRSLRALCTTTLVLLAAYGALVSFERKRVLAIGPHFFYEDAPLVAIDRPAFFAGIRAAPSLVTAVDALDAVLRSRGYAGRSDAPVLFSPRLEFAYPAWGIVPVPRRPLLWEFLPAGAAVTTEEVRRLGENPPELCVYLVGERDEMSSYPPELRRYLADHYASRVEGPLRLLERKR